MRLRKLNKKALLESTLGKVVLGAIIIVILIGFVLIASGRLSAIWKQFARVFRFG